MDEQPIAWVYLKGALRDLQPHPAPAHGLTATAQGDRGRYGDAWFVTFPATRHLDLWVRAVAQATAEAADRADPHDAPELRVELWGELRSGPPITPAGARLATVLVARVRFPTLDAATLARAGTLCRAALRQRARRTHRKMNAFAAEDRAETC